MNGGPPTRQNHILFCVINNFHTKLQNRIFLLFMACGLWTHARQSSRKMASSIVTHELQLLRGLLGATHTHKRRESPLQSVIRPFHRPHIMRLYIRSVISVLFAIYWCETHAVDAWYITFISCRSFETIHYEAHSLGDLSAGTLHLILQQFISVRYEEVKPDSFSTGKFFPEFLERMNETHCWTQLTV